MHDQIHSNHPLPSWRWLQALHRITVAVAVATLFAANLFQAPVNAQTTGELRIGYQKSASLFVLQKAQGSLEKRLAPLGFGVKWVEFPAGPQLLEGLSSRARRWR